MNTKIILFLAAFFAWILLSWPIDSETIWIGIFVGVLISFLTCDVFERKAKAFKDIIRYAWFAYYIPVFIWECVKANFDGAYRVVHPGLPIRPGIVKVKTTLKSDTGLTLLANSLTLKPGTMTVDIDKENGLLYVHWIDVKTEDIDKATELIAGRFERILKRIFE